MTASQSTPRPRDLQAVRRVVRTLKQIPVSSDADRKRRSELERELAAYSTPAQRCDLEATLDHYPDDITYELRDILASQAMAARHNPIPGAGQY